jgi:hypothetical protein
MYRSETAAVDGTVGCAWLAPLPSARRDVPHHEEKNDDSESSYFHRHNFDA